MRYLVILGLNSYSSSIDSLLKRWSFGRLVTQLKCILFNQLGRYNIQINKCQNWIVNK